MIPPGRASQFHERYDRLVDTWLEDSGKMVYEIQPGDNLSVIAARFNVPLPALLIWNGLNPHKPIHPGDMLVIYTDKALEESDER